MESFAKAAGFTYNQDSFSATLEIHVHHARNIHNICIYDNQDVYAKFSLTYNPDETLSTRIVNGGGKNPDFNERLIVKIHQPDAVLKCEIWMMSRVKSYMDDQLLGFALVPISSLSAKGKLTQDFHLSSTDLFHSPAGTIKLSLFLNAETQTPPHGSSFADSAVDDNSSATSELLLDKKVPEEYSRLEFPDINVASENHQMVSEYFARNGGSTLVRPWPEKPDGSFLHLGAPVDDCEMGGNSNSSYEYHAGSVSPDGNSGFLSSTMTSLSDDRNSADSTEKKGHFFAELSTSPDENASPISKKKSEAQEENRPGFSGKEEESNEKRLDSGVARNVKLEAEESVMQKQIVDMYMRSMQQFTESLAKMKLPMDLDKPEIDNEGDLDDEKKKKKDNSRVFYGSRAFF